MDEQKNSYWKFVGAFLVLMVLGLTAFAISVYYENRSIGQLPVIEQTKSDGLNQRILADNYGGKTPRETLSLYINAIKNGDYVLASKYFVVEGQPDALDVLQNATGTDLSVYLNVLNSAQMGKLLPDDTFFSAIIKAESDTSTIEFTKYPSGVWKIMGI